MAADNLSRFGAYAYSPANGVYLASFSEPMAARLRTAPTPGYDGQYMAASLAGTVKVGLSGVLKGDTPTDLRSKFDAFRAAHAPGPLRPLYRDGDRFRMAQMSGIGKAERGSKTVLSLDFDVEFECQPYEEADTPQTGALAAGASILTAGGTAPALPVFTLALSAAPAGSSVVLVLTPPGGVARTITFFPLTADTFTVDSNDESVRDGAGLDVTATLDGAFPRLLPGDNALTLTLAGGATLASASALWRPRWY